MNTKIKNSFAVLWSIIMLALLALAFTPNSQAATWNNAYGAGGGDGDGYFSGSGIPFALITSVQSNSYYTIQGGRQALGSARIQSVWVNTDTAAGTLRFYVPTNTYNLASNQPAGTNILWLASTNAGIATNDICILEHTDGTCQLVLVSGNATDAGGLVYTNASGYCGIKLFNTPTNAIQGDINGGADRLHKCAMVQSLTPLAVSAFTNGITLQGFGSLINLSWNGVQKQYIGPVATPVALVLTYSNAAGMLVEGDFKRREQ